MCSSDSAKQLSVAPMGCHSRFTRCHKATGHAQIRLALLKSRCHAARPAQYSCQSQQLHLKKDKREEGGGWFMEYVCVKMRCEVFEKQRLIKFQHRALGSGTSSCGGVQICQGTSEVSRGRTDESVRRGGVM